MAVDMFLKIEGVQGESKDGKHGKEIDVLSFSWGATQSGNIQLGGGGGSGKVNVQDLSFTHYVDSASHSLFQAVCTGKHFDKANLVVRKAGGNQLEYIKIDMSDCIITSWQTGGSGGEDRLMESVTMQFAKVKFAYIPQKKDGSGEAEKTFTYDIAKNEAA